MSSTEVLRDKYGNKVGEVSAYASKYVLRDKYGNLLGSYDADSGWTRDLYGNPVGRGNLLTTLLSKVS